MTGPVVARQILVSGIVQGVGYRMWLRRTAVDLGLRGFVRNLDDGRVEAFVEGDERNVDALVVKCWKGPSGASVDDVTQAPRTTRNATAFVIAPDASAPDSPGAA